MRVAGTFRQLRLIPSRGRWARINSCVNAGRRPDTTKRDEDMTATATAARTNIGTRHPEMYRTLTTMAANADKAAIAAGLPPLLLELVKIRVSQINGCAYCLRIHTADSLAQGESPERLGVLSAWQETSYFDDQEGAGLFLAEYLTMIHDSNVNRRLYDLAAEHLDPAQVSALSWLVLSINTFNRIAISSSYKVAPAGR